MDALKLTVSLLNQNVHNPRAITQISNFLRAHESLRNEIEKLLKENVRIVCRDSNRYTDAQTMLDVIDNLGFDSKDLWDLFDESYLKPGREILIPITRENPDLLCMVCLKALGDTIFAAGFSQAIQKQRDKIGTCLIMYEKNREVAEFYPHVKKTCLMSREDMEKIERYLRATKIPETENFIYGSLPWLNGQTVVYSELGLINIWRRALNLPPDSEYTYASLPNPPKSLSRQDYSRAIILFPIANSIQFPMLTSDFWKELVKNLKRFGFEIYTNLAPNEKPIEGTIPLRASLREIFFIAEQSRFCIGVQSGIFDLLAQSKARIISINLRRYFSWFDLQTTYQRKNLWTVYFNTPDYNPASDQYQAEFFSKTEDIGLKILSIVRNFKE